MSEIDKTIKLAQFIDENKLEESLLKDIYSYQDRDGLKFQISFCLKAVKGLVWGVYSKTEVCLFSVQGKDRTGVGILDAQKLQIPKKMEEGAQQHFDEFLQKHLSHPESNIIWGGRRDVKFIAVHYKKVINFEVDDFLRI